MTGSPSNINSDHFLAPQTISLGLQDNHNDNHLIDTTTLASADFDVDVKSGFLSPSAPLKRLTNREFRPWELALDWIQSIISKVRGTEETNTSTSKKIKDQVEEWKENIITKIKVVEITSLLTDIIQLRRAHLVLAFLTHAFVHSDSILLQLCHPDIPSNIIIPASLAVPFYQISHALDIPPVLTYADTVLYNWYFKDPTLGFTVSNLEITTTFTQTESEKHFYKTSVLVEALGPECLNLMRSSLDEAFMGDSTSVKRIGSNLEKLSKLINRISKVLAEVRDGCDPKTFYWDIRPWMNAGKWTWEGVDSLEKVSSKREPIANNDVGGKNWRTTEFGGPSAGQSTLIHAIDVFLGVNHEPNKQEVASGIQDEETFMKRMSTYMPHHHRSFLNHLAQSCLTNVDHNGHDSDNDNRPRRSNLIRSIVMNHSDENSPLYQNYNECILSLENLRKTHTKIVSLYIISQKNSKRKQIPLINENSSSSNPMQSASKQASASSTVKTDQDEKIKEEESRSNYSSKNKTNGEDVDHTNPTHHHNSIGVKNNNLEVVLKGTGGTDLIKFLKRCRLRTSQALIQMDR